MKPLFTRLLLVFSLTLALLLSSSPARADGGVELASVALSINGQDQPLEFSPDKTEYEIRYTSAVPVEITVTAQAAAPCKLRIDNVPYEDGRGSAAISVADKYIINLQAYYKTHSQLYLIHVTIVPPAPPAPSGNQEQGGDSGGSGQNSGNGNAPANGGQSSGSGSSPANGGQSSGSGSSPANAGQSSDNGNAPANAGQSSGSDSSPANGGANEAVPFFPHPTGAMTDPEQSGADLADEPHTTHLILYIGAPFLLADETYIPADTAPYLVTDANGGGYTMVPVRFIAEALGASVSWDGTARKVGIDLDGRHFDLTIGQLVPGTPVAAVIRDSRTFVPLRYVMESFGARVEWTQREQRIDIYYTAWPG